MTFHRYRNNSVNYM